MGLIFQHGRDGTVNFSENIIAYDYKGNAGRSQVFLGTTINEGIFGYINRTAEYV